MTIKEVFSKLDFSFLSSNRFWALVVGAVSLYAYTKGWIGQAEMDLIAVISFAFIGIRTIDRFGEKIGLPTENLPK